MRLLIAALILAMTSSVAEPAAAAYKAKTPYSFCPDGDCTDGQPLDVIATPGGTLYGVTPSGGFGTVFALVPNAKGTKWKYQRVWNFCSQSNCTDGEMPNSGLIVDMAGNLYGTTSQGGTHSQGVLFRLAKKGKTWALATLYNFCGASDCSDTSPSIRLTYAGAASGAPYDGTSPLYAANYTYGFSGGEGAVFSLTPADGEWTQATLYRFCLKKNCPDGENPMALLADSSGNLFGTTEHAGGDSAGTVFELSGGVLTTLHSFCSACTTDGKGPQGQIAIDGKGNLYGATAGGGTSSHGTIYKLVPKGKKSTVSLLYSLCPNGDCSVSGSNVFSGVVLDADGNLFGSAESGGAQHGGTVFEVGKTFKVLHAFCGCSGEGDSPISLTADGSGNLFGADLFGGLQDQGTIFELKR